VDGRDPMVIPLGAAFNHTFLLVYTGTNPDSVTGTVSHVNYARTSSDLLHWSDAFILFDGGVDGNNFGGPTESPFMVRRGANFYLFNGAWDGQYAYTHVWLSTNPFQFGSVPLGTAVCVGSIPSHALEVVRDSASGSEGGGGGWYVTHAGWGQGGVWMAPIVWSDGLDAADTSMPVPPLRPALPPNFQTTLSGWVPALSSSAEQHNGSGSGGYGVWSVTPSGLFGGDSMEQTCVVATTASGGGALPSIVHSMFSASSWLIVPVQLTCVLFGAVCVCVWLFIAGSNFVYRADVILLTKDGNPTSQPNNNTRAGSAASLLLAVGDASDPMGAAGAYAVTLHTDSQDNGGGSGLKVFRFAPQYTELAAVPLDVVQGQLYSVLVQVQYPTASGGAGQIAVSLNGALLATATDSMFLIPGRFLGVHVWQGSAQFQSVVASAVAADA
jgi:hypothetical protein